MWTHHTDETSGWKYSVTSNRFIIQLTGGSICIVDSKTKNRLRQHKGHNYLYTGDISPDETQCFALENGKHFYIYSLENYELIKRITLPRGYECIDMYGHYTEDGKEICIPAKKWTCNKHGPDSCEYILCRYDAQNLTLNEKTALEDPSPYKWIVDDPPLELDESETEDFWKAADIIAENLDNKEFLDNLLALKPGDDPKLKEVLKFIYDKFSF